jgi:hypothetical protein
MPTATEGRAQMGDRLIGRPRPPSVCVVRNSTGDVEVVV